MLTQVFFDEYTTTAGQAIKQKVVTSMNFNLSLDANSGVILEAFNI